jgi:exopolysaccharide biosynthesis polyprenyl glycosylphosphotransferase
MTPFSSRRDSAVALDDVIALPAGQPRWMGQSGNAPPAPPLRRLAHPRALGAAETLTALTVLVAVVLATNLQSMPNGLGEFLALRISLKNLLLLVAFGTIWPAVSHSLDLYDERRLRSFRGESARVLLAGTIGALLTVTFALVSVSGAFGLRQTLYFWAGNAVVGLTVRALWRPLCERQRRRDARHVIIVGAGPRAAEIYRSLVTDPETRYEIAGLVDSASPRSETFRLPPPVLGTIAELEAILMRQPIDEVFIALPVRSHYHQIQETIRICEQSGVHAKYRADIFAPTFAQANYESWDGSHVMAMHVVPHGLRVKIKRMIDIIGAAVLLVVLAPLMLLIAIAIKLSGPGPSVFAQQRYGLNKRRFAMLKFRTMVPNAEQLQAQLEQHNEANGPVFKIARDPRVTPLGCFLRKSSLDELPQLWHVLRGQMSLVGPRPLPLRDVSRFTRPTDMRRFSVPPGLTGLWQVSGRSNLSFDRWIELDLQYIDRWSLLLDLRILLKTVPAVFHRVGAS